ncbi:hydroxyacyl-thioester dehydratase type 2, mitochondrial-like [Ptychodera flava]|uniref:hydroxyacyl-thioester dehydratase type 2, mitochondrial-like n=1 Tax=Ptychodera flava TaxID=63121 RepID=UPI003969FD9F
MLGLSSAAPLEDCERVILVISHYAMNVCLNRTFSRNFCSKLSRRSRFWFKEGDTAEVSKVISESDVRAFAELTGDVNPIHTDEKYAETTRFGKCVVHGVLIQGLISAVLGTRLPGSGAILVSQEMKFPGPLFVGEEVMAKVEVKSIQKAIINMAATCTAAERDKIVMSGYVKLYMPLDSSETSSQQVMKR